MSQRDWLTTFRLRFKHLGTQESVRKKKKKPQAEEQDMRLITRKEKQWLKWVVVQAIGWIVMLVLAGLAAWAAWMITQ